jgi:hypothetical protein
MRLLAEGYLPTSRHFKELSLGPEVAGTDGYVPNQHIPEKQKTGRWAFVLGSGYYQVGEVDVQSAHASHLTEMIAILRALSTIPSRANAFLVVDDRGAVNPAAALASGERWADVLRRHGWVGAALLASTHAHLQRLEQVEILLYRSNQHPLQRMANLLLSTPLEDLSHLILAGKTIPQEQAALVHALRRATSIAEVQAPSIRFVVDVAQRHRWKVVQVGVAATCDQ